MPKQLKTKSKVDSTLEERRNMVERQLIARGIDDRQIIEAFLTVPREEFVAEELTEFAYQDTPLQIEAEQTISQPYIVALMAQLLELHPNDRVLEVGTGSGYAAAILGCIANEVFTIERHQILADIATRRLRKLGFDRVHVRCGDGTLGWPEQAPFDAIVVAAGGPEAPKSLLKQLSIGGRLVIPVGANERSQRLQRVTREGVTNYRFEDLGSVCFVPLIGEEGWQDAQIAQRARIVPSPGKRESLVKLLGEEVRHLERIEGADCGELLERIGDARVVLIGEATHGTSEFYRMRAEITKALISQKGFRIVGIEADWPDTMYIHRYSTGRKPDAVREMPFTRFPTWMWRNREVVHFIEWLRGYNADVGREGHCGFFGLDLYSLFCSIEAVISYLERVDKRTAELARSRYSCLTPWQSDPASYGLAAITGKYRSCETEVVAMLQELLKRRIEYQQQDAEQYLDVLQNSRVVSKAEQYYRAMYYGGAASWNLRDRHMFDTLLSLLSFYGERSKAVVWAHNSHVGNARATEMSVRGEYNIGQLCRVEFGDKAFSIGFGTDHGKVAAASNWGGEMEIKNVQPSHPESYERLFHETEIKAFSLHLRSPSRTELREELMTPRLGRAIGVIYRPETELQSHYYQAILPVQFDEYIWFDETNAVNPFDHPQVHGLPDTFPSGL